jgi:tetratricopeptide (TPR) repeat protein
VDAVPMFEELIKKYPEEPKYLAKRAFCALNMGYPEEALRYFRKAMETWPHSQGVYEGIRIYTGLYQTYRELRMLKEAMGIAVEGLKRFPDEDPALYQSLADAFLSMGWPNEAKKILKREIDKFPDDQELKEFLKKVEENMDDPDGGVNGSLLGLLLLAAIHKKLRRR